MVGVAGIDGLDQPHRHDLGTDDIVDGTRRRYVEAFERITGTSFDRYLEEDVVG